MFKNTYGVRETSEKRPVKKGYFAPLAEAIKEVVSIPVILTGGITEIQSAEQLLAEKRLTL